MERAGDVRRVWGWLSAILTARKGRAEPPGLNRQEQLQLQPLVPGKPDLARSQFKGGGPVRWWWEGKHGRAQEPQDPLLESCLRSLVHSADRADNPCGRPPLPCCGEPRCCGASSQRPGQGRGTGFGQNSGVNCACVGRKSRAFQKSDGPRTAVWPSGVEPTGLSFPGVQGCGNNSASFIAHVGVHCSSRHLRGV